MHVVARAEVTDRTRVTIGLRGMASGMLSAVELSHRLYSYMHIVDPDSLEVAAFKIENQTADCIKGEMRSL